MLLEWQRACCSSRSRLRAGQQGQLGTAVRCHQHCVQTRQRWGYNEPAVREWDQGARQRTSHRSHTPPPDAPLPHSRSRRRKVLPENCDDPPHRTLKQRSSQFEGTWSANQKCDCFDGMGALASVVDGLVSSRYRFGAVLISACRPNLQPDGWLLFHP